MFYLFISESIIRNKQTKDCTEADYKRTVQNYLMIGKGGYWKGKINLLDFIFEKANYVFK